MGFFGEFDNAHPPTGIAPVSTPKPAAPAAPKLGGGGFLQGPKTIKGPGGISTIAPGQQLGGVNPNPVGIAHPKVIETWRKANPTAGANWHTENNVPLGGSVAVGGGPGQPGLGGPGGGGFDMLSPQVKQHLGLGPGGGFGPGMRAHYDQSWAAGRIPGSPGYEASVTANPNIDPQTGQPWQATDQGGWGQKTTTSRTTSTPLGIPQTRAPQRTLPQRAPAQKSRWWTRSLVGRRR